MTSAGLGLALSSTYVGDESITTTYTLYSSLIRGIQVLGIPSFLSTPLSGVYTGTPSRRFTPYIRGGIAAIEYLATPDCSPNPEWRGE